MSFQPAGPVADDDDDVPLRVHVERDRFVTVVRVRGDIDLETVHLPAGTIETVLDDAPLRVALDVSGVGAVFHIEFAPSPEPGAPAAPGLS